MLLHNDICRCANEKCVLECRRKEPPNPGSDIRSISYFNGNLIDGKCEYLIKKKE